MHFISFCSADRDFCLLLFLADWTLSQTERSCICISLNPWTWPLVLALWDVTAQTGLPSTEASQVETISSLSPSSSLLGRWGEGDCLLGLGPYGEAGLGLFLTGIFSFRPVLDSLVRKGMLG